MIMRMKSDVLRLLSISIISNIVNVFLPMKPRLVLSFVIKDQRTLYWYCFSILFVGTSLYCWISSLDVQCVQLFLY